MANDPLKVPRAIKRGQHTLAPQRWRMILIVTDTPEAGEGYLTKEQVIEETLTAMDLPAGIAVEIGTVEMAAKGST